MSEPVSALLGGAALASAGLAISTAEDRLLRTAAVVVALIAIATAVGKLFVMFRRLLATLEDLNQLLRHQRAESAFIYSWFRAWQHNVELVRGAHAAPWAAGLIGEVAIPPHMRVYATDPETLTHP